MLRNTLFARVQHISTTGTLCSLQLKSVASVEKKELLSITNLDCFFYVNDECLKHSNFDANHLWVRERPQRKEAIHFNSLLSFVDGEWVGNAWKDT